MAEPYIYAQLLREGTSDDGLESILQATLIDMGCNPDSAIIPAPPTQQAIRQFPTASTTFLGREHHRWSLSIAMLTTLVQKHAKTKLVRPPLQSLLMSLSFR